MNIILFIIVGIAIFFSLFLGGKRFRSTALYALAIGGVVNANFFHAATYPINCFGLPFGIDSLIYTLFIFCVLVMLFSEGKKQAYLLAFSSIIAIMFSALMQLTSDLLSSGNSAAVWNTFLTFLTSSVASVIAICFMIEFINKIKENVNNYWLLIIGIIIATIINSGIYYPISMLILGAPANTASILLASLIGKLIAMLIALLTFFILTKIDKKNYLY